MRLADIQGGMVVNVIEVDPGFVPDWASAWVDIGVEGGPGWSWDGTSLTPPPAPDRLPALRATASLDRVTFCKALKNLGVLPVSEAVIAARGEWPATFASFVTGLSEDAAADAQIEWAGAANIHYTHPLLQQIALAYAASDPAQATAILDAIFGIA